MGQSWFIRNRIRDIVHAYCYVTMILALGLEGVTCMRVMVVIMVVAERRVRYKNCQKRKFGPTLY